jgi:hypothetical protein
VSKKWKKPCFGQKRGKIDRSYYELVAFTELKNNIRSGDISVEGSMIHRNIDDYLVDLSACIDSENYSRHVLRTILKDREIIFRFTASIFIRQLIREFQEQTLKKLEKSYT